MRYAGGTWRVGGLLVRTAVKAPHSPRAAVTSAGKRALTCRCWLQALSRAFGDAYLKSSAQFEGVPAGSDGYSSGFGLTSEPYIVVDDVKGVRSVVLLKHAGFCSACYALCARYPNCIVHASQAGAITHP